MDTYAILPALHAEPIKMLEYRTGTITYETNMKYH